MNRVLESVDRLLEIPNAKTLDTKPTRILTHTLVHTNESTCREVTEKENKPR